VSSNFTEEMSAQALRPGATFIQPKGFEENMA
jgi:hypothetical protein